jgi:hypothetical protein
MSTSAAHHLSPAFPERAAWGTASRSCAPGRRRRWRLPAQREPRLPRRGHARRRQDDVRPAGGHRTPRPRHHPGGHRRRPDRAPQDPVGGRRGARGRPPQPRVLQLQSGCSPTSTTVWRSPMRRSPPTRPARARRTIDTPTLVILDEIHHGGDAKSWGDGIREAFEPATRRLSLTGTPFRSDTSPIPFVRYEMGEDGILRSASDHTYGYAEALRDGVVRPVLFLAYGGAMRWRTKAGDEVSARLGEPLTKDLTAQAWRTALDPKGEWVPSVLAAADKRLSEVRRHVPDAGGLVIASNQTRSRVRQAAPGHHREWRPPSCSPTTPGRAPASRVRRPTPHGGWSPCGWCPKVSTCRACAWASMRRRPRRRCSSPRPSDASCGPASGVRPPRCSCPRCR